MGCGASTQTAAATKARGSDALPFTEIHEEELGDDPEDDDAAVRLVSSKELTSWEAAAAERRAPPRRREILEASRAGPVHRAVSLEWLRDFEERHRQGASLSRPAPPRPARNSGPPPLVIDPLLPPMRDDARHTFFFFLSLLH